MYLEHVEEGLGKADGVHGDGDAVGQREHEACAPTNQHCLSRKHPQLFQVQIMLWIHWYGSSFFFRHWLTRCQQRLSFFQSFLAYYGTF
jgi:hypothetical protein